MQEDFKIKLIKTDESYTDASNKLKGFANVQAPAGVKALFALYDNLKREHAGFTPLIIFDDVGQCEYTNMHAMSDFYFELDEDDESLRVEGKSDYYAAEFRNTLEILDENRLKIGEIYGKMDYSEEIERLNLINQKPFLAIGDEVQVRLCPCESGAASFAAMINGYFADDFTPHESYALIRFLHDEFGYEFIGISDKILLFRRTQNLSDAQRSKLICELAKIYGTDEAALDGQLGVNEALLLPYIESLGDLYALDEYIKDED